jgi:hypothetical protein
VKSDKTDGSTISLRRSREQVSLARLRFIFDRLYDFEPFEFRVSERERFALAGLLVGGADLVQAMKSSCVAHIVCDE